MPSLTKVQTGFVEAQGALPLSSGTAAAPGLKFDDHDGTGMFSPSTGEIAFSTSGHSQAVTFKTDGKVGIGIANPVLKTHIYNTANADVALIESTQNFATIRFKSATNTSGPTVGIDGAGGLQLDQKDTSKYIAFAIGSERLRITSGGDVGIGETSPDVRLHIKETFNTAYSLANVADEANHLLKLENPSTTANAFAGMQFRVGSGADLFFGAIQQSVNHGDFFFTNQNSPQKEMMRIKSTGLVGIGTDNPGGTLHLDSDGGATLRLSRLGTNSAKYIQLEHDGSNGTLTSTDDTIFRNGGSERVRINSDGKLILSGTQRTTPFISGDGGMCIEQSYDGNLRALTIRNKDSDATAATSLGFSLNRSGGDYDFISGEIKSVKEQTWTTTDSTIDSAMTFSTTANNALTERLRITSAGHMTMGVPNYSFNNAKGFDTYLGMAFNQYDGGILMTSSSGLYAGEWSFGLEASGSHTHFVILDDANERLRINSDGTIRLKSDGTAANKARFEINEKWNNNATDFGIDFKRTYDVGGDDQDAGFIHVKRNGGSSQTGMSFGVGNRGDVSERLLITSGGNVSIGALASPGALLHLRDSNNATQGNAQLKISKGVGSGAAPTSTSRANCYIHLGSSEWGSGANGQYLMGFGYTNGETGTGIPAYIGFKETSTSGYTIGDLIFGTRDNNTGTNNAQERLRIRSNGDLILGPYDAPGSYTTPANNVPYSIKVAPYGWQHHSELAEISMGNHSGSNGNDDGEIVFKTTKNAHSSTTGLVERLRINSDGIVTKPNQPAFLVTGSFTLTSWNGVYYPLWSDSGNAPTYDIGNHYSNGVFTAPVDGRYLFSAHFLTDNGSGYVLWRFYKNTSTYMSGWHQVYDPGTVANFTSTSGTQIIQLSQNDTVRIGFNASHTEVYTLSYNYFMGYLLG